MNGSRALRRHSQAMVALMGEALWAACRHLNILRRAGWRWAVRAVVTRLVPEVGLAAELALAHGRQQRPALDQAQEQRQPRAIHALRQSTAIERRVGHEKAAAALIVSRALAAQRADVWSLRLIHTPNLRSVRSPVEQRR